MRLGPIAVALLLAAVPALPANDNWPAFRGPTADGISDSTSVPTAWSETENVRWKTPIHGKGWSSPVVWGDQVWVTTADEVGGVKGGDSSKGGGQNNPVQKATFFAVCVDRKTGKVIHDIKLGHQDNPQFCHPFNSYASPTPCIEEGRVYAHFGSLGTWCIDTATGKVLWERRDLKCDHFRGPGSSPILYKNLLMLIYDGADVQYVCALDKATGKTVWLKDRETKFKPGLNGDYKKAYATPRVLEVNGRAEMVCPSSEVTVAYDPLTGAELWRLTHGGMNGSARVAAGHGLIFLNNGHLAQLQAIKQGVAGAVPESAVAWTTKKNVCTRSSMLLVGDLLFMVSDGGMASCLDAKTGTVHWAERLDGEYSASPVFAGGNVYFCNQIGKTYVVAAKPEYTPVNENRLGAGSGDGYMASPAIAGHDLFLRTKSHLYRVGNK